MLLLITLIILLSFPVISYSNPLWYIDEEKMENFSQVQSASILSNNLVLTVTVSLALIFMITVIIRAQKSYIVRLTYFIDRLLIPKLSTIIPVILRMSLGSILIFFSLGYFFKLDIEMINNSKLFSPEVSFIDFIAINSDFKYLFYLNVMIAFMFILGFFVRYAALALIGLLLFYIYLFGFLNFYYIFYYISCSMILVYFGNGKYITVNIPKFQENIENKIYKILKWYYVYHLGLFLIGITFIYTGIFHKIIDANLLIMIFENNNFPSFGIRYDIFMIILALIEIAMGILLMIGIFIRPISLISLIFIYIFSVYFQLPLVFYAHQIGFFLTTLIMGNSKLLQSNKKKSHKTYSQKVKNYSQKLINHGKN